MLSQRAKHGEPQAAPVAAPSENMASKRDLTSWWKNFSKRSVKKEEEQVETPTHIFGVPLLTSVRYANVAISLFDNEGKSYIYGYVPIIVAKCGVFLKEKATEVEGIFRLAGSEKRIKELKAIFDSQEKRFGKGLNWEGYNVHDAANILRRYFNTLPEPIIPLQYYEAFRNPVRNHQEQAVGYAIGGQAPSQGDFDANAAIITYQMLVTEIPPLNRQLLLYILDLLAVFAAKADVNKMTTQNLASIFQPGILSHPAHAMEPGEYRLSQDVLMFLIDNQDHFLIGMHGTGADEKTVRDIESGPPKQASTPPRTKTLLGRSSSNASAGAESLRKFGGIRRNVSVSSRNSRGSTPAAQSPVASSFANSPTVGVHRSNTLPSKKSPAIGATRFIRPGEKRSDPPTPTSSGTIKAATVTAAEKPVEVALDVSSPPSEDITPLAEPPKPNPMGSIQNTPEAQPANVAVALESIPSNEPLPPPGQSEESLGGITPTATSGVPGRTFTQMFARGLSSEQVEKQNSRKAKPNKLQKRRTPSANPSAHSSTQSLTGMMGNEVPHSPVGVSGSQSTLSTTNKEATSSNVLEASPNRGSLQPATSPSASFRSHSTSTDVFESDHGDDTQIAGVLGESEKKSRWRVSSSHHKYEAKNTDVGSNSRAQQSTSTIGDGSTSGRGRKSLERITPWTSDVSGSSHRGGESETGTPPKEHRGLGGWLKERFGDKDKRERAKSPPDSSGSRQALQGMDQPVRGKSMEVPRRESDQTVHTIKATTSPAEQAGATAAAQAAVRLAGTSPAQSGQPTMGTAQPPTPVAPPSQAPAGPAHKK